MLDLGCGYGGFLLYLREQGHVGEYHGMDLSPEMVAATRAYGQGDLLATFEVGALPSQPADFVVSSGIFSVRVDVSDEEWEAHMADTVRAMAAACRHGFGFNWLTTRRDFSQEHLYYADPDAWSGFCARLFGAPVELLQDYGLYEFTILARKVPGGDGWSDQ